MAQSIDVVDGLGLDFEEFVLKGRGVGRLALGLAGRGLGDLSDGVHSLGLHVGRIVLADDGRLHGVAGLGLGPLVGGLVPIVTDHDGDHGLLVDSQVVIGLQRGRGDFGFNLNVEIKSDNGNRAFLDRFGACISNRDQAGGLIHVDGCELKRRINLAVLEDQVLGIVFQGGQAIVEEHGLFGGLGLGIEVRGSHVDCNVGVAPEIGVLQDRGIQHDGRTAGLRAGRVQAADDDDLIVLDRLKVDVDVVKALLLEQDHIMRLQGLEGHGHAAEDRRDGGAAQAVAFLAAFLSGFVDIDGAEGADCIRIKVGQGGEAGRAVDPADEVGGDVVDGVVVFIRRSRDLGEVHVVDAADAAVRDEHAVGVLGLIVRHGVSRLVLADGENGNMADLAVLRAHTAVRQVRIDNPVVERAVVAQQDVVEVGQTGLLVKLCTDKGRSDKAADAAQIEVGQVAVFLEVHQLAAAVEAGQDVGVIGQSRFVVVRALIGRVDVGIVRHRESGEVGGIPQRPLRGDHEVIIAVVGEVVFRVVAVHVVVDIVAVDEVAGAAAAGEGAEHGVAGQVRQTHVAQVDLRVLNVFSAKGNLAVDRGIHRLTGRDIDGRAGAHIGRLVGGSGDDRGAGRNSGDQAIRVDGGNFLVGGGPGNRAVRQDDRLDVGRQLDGRKHIEDQGRGLGRHSDGRGVVRIHLVLEAALGEQVDRSNAGAEAEVAVGKLHAIAVRCIGTVKQGIVLIDEAVDITGASPVDIGAVDLVVGQAAAVIGVDEADAFAVNRLRRPEEAAVHVFQRDVGAQFVGHNVDADRRDVGLRALAAQRIAGAGVDVGNDVVLAFLEGVGQDVDRLGAGDRLVGIKDDQVGLLVGGIVADEDGNAVGQIQLGDVEGDLDLLTRFGLLGDSLGESHIAADVHDGDIGDVVVVLRGDGDLGAVFAHLGRGFRCGVIHGEDIAECRAPAKFAGGEQVEDFLVGDGVDVLTGVEHHAVVLGDGEVADHEHIVFVQTELCRGGIDGGCLGRGVLPGLAIDVVPGAGGRAADVALKDIQRVPVECHPAGGGSVADHVVFKVDQLGAAADSRALGMVLLLNDVGVAHEDSVALAVVEGQVVGVGIAGVALLGAAVGRGDRIHAVKHGGVGPAAVEAQDGDGVRHVEQRAVLGLADGQHVGVAFHVGAANVVGVKELLEFIGVGDGDGDGHALAGGNQQIVQTALLLPLEQQLRVIGADAVDLVHFGGLEIQGLAVDLAGQVVQNGLRVGRVGRAVLVDVVAAEHDLRIGIADGEVLTLGQVHGSLQHVEVAVADRGSLGEHIGAQFVDQVRVAEVVHVEAEAVFAAAGSVLAKLNLDLAVRCGGGGILAHHDVGQSLRGGIGVAQAGALLQNGEVSAVHHHRGSGAHQEGVDQGAAVQAGDFLEIVVTDVLAEQGRHAGDVRGGHRGAAHELVLIGAAGDGTVRVLVAAEHGVDVAAGRRDFRLHDQGAGNAPGAEVGDRSLGTVRVQGGFHLVGHGHGALVVEHVAVLVGDGLGCSLDGLAFGLEDGNSGDGVLITGQVHVNAAGLIVDDDDSGSTLRGRGIGLRKEGGGAAVAHGDFARQDLGAECEERIAFLADMVVVIHAGAVNQDKIVGTGDRGHVRIAVALGLGVEDGGVIAAELQRGANGAYVLSRRHAEAVDKGTGRAAGVQAHVIQVEVRNTGGQEVRPVVGVARGDRHHGAAVNEAVHDLLIAVGEGVAGSAGAQGQVDGICLQDDGVLDGGHVVGVVSTAARAEDLHGEDLGVRRNADGEHFGRRFDELAVLLDEAVGGRNTGHVRAVLFLGVAQVVGGVVAVDVVVGEGDLRVFIDVVGAVDVVLVRGVVRVQLGQHRLDLVDVQQLEVALIQRKRIHEGFRIEGLVLVVGTGIDDRHAGAGAGIALGPQRSRADHVLGGDGGVDAVDLRLISGLKPDFLDAGDGLNGLDIAVADLGGNDVDRQRQVPLDVHRNARIGDGRFNIGLLLFQGMAVGHGAVVLNDVLRGVTQIHC